MDCITSFFEVGFVAQITYIHLIQRKSVGSGRCMYKQKLVKSLSRNE